MNASHASKLYDTLEFHPTRDAINDTFSIGLTFMNEHMAEGAYGDYSVNDNIFYGLDIENLNITDEDFIYLNSLGWDYDSAYKCFTYYL